MLTERKWKLETVPYLIVGLFLSICLGIIVMSLLGLNGIKEQSGIPSGGRLGYLLVSTVFVHFALFVMMIVFLRVNRLGWTMAFGLRNGAPLRVLGWGFMGAAVFLPIGWLFSKICTLAIQKAGGKVEAQSAVQIMQAQPPLAETLFLAFSTVVIAPVIEEALFRGILYPSVKQAGYPRVALYGVALLFASYHNNLMAFVPLFVLALVLVAAYEATDNLLAPILLHACFNAANYLVLIWQVDLDQYYRWVERLIP